MPGSRDRPRGRRGRAPASFPLRAALRLRVPAPSVGHCAEAREIEACAERAPLAGQHHRPHAGVAAEAIPCFRDGPQHRVVERVHHLGSLQPHVRDPVANGDTLSLGFGLGFGHASSPRGFEPPGPSGRADLLASSGGSALASRVRFGSVPGSSITEPSRLRRRRLRRTCRGESRANGSRRGPSGAQRILRVCRWRRR